MRADTKFNKRTAPLVECAAVVKSGQAYALVLLTGDSAPANLDRFSIHMTRREALELIAQLADALSKHET